VSDINAFNQAQVVEYILREFPEFSDSITKIKFYKIIDKDLGMLLRFFLVWCDFNLEAREVLFESSEKITASSGWYPVITGCRVFHHDRSLLDFVDNGLRRAMNKSNIEKLPGLGELLDIIKFSKGSGSSILLRTTIYDLLLDTGMPDDELNVSSLRSNLRKWIFISHNHQDHTGGLRSFVKDKDFVISMSPISLELYLNVMADVADLNLLLPRHFFYRLAPMWYRSVYKFADGSSVETVPTYHCPGSMGFIFTFSNGKTLFYSGDINVSESYLTEKVRSSEFEIPGFDLGRSHIDYGIIDASFVGRKIGSIAGSPQDLIDAIENSIITRRNHLLLTQPTDYGYFLFLHLYDTMIAKSTRRVDIRLFIDGQILKQLEIIEWRMKRKQLGSLDNALIEFLKRRKTFAESVRVYNFNVNTEENLINMNERKLNAVFILDEQRINDQEYISNTVLRLMEEPGLDISRVGKAATKPTTSERSLDRNIAGYDDSFWLLHTNEELLGNYLIAGKQTYRELYLFHNFKKRLKNFIKQIEQSGRCEKVTSL